MRTDLYWVDGPWPGKLAISARPRGGDWLQDEMTNWRRAGIKTVVSLLTPEEESELDLASEETDAAAQGIAFISFPIPDRRAPASEAEIAKVLEKLAAALSAGNHAVVHCRQGIGRAGLVASCLLVSKGWDVATAVERIGEARGVPVPETSEQRHFIDHYAATLTGVK